MADPETKVKRQAWREGIDLDAPLAGQLPEPYVSAWQAAYVMGVADSTVYESCKRFDAAMRRGDIITASRNVPCVIFGTTHRIPTAAFVEWWTTAGQATLRLLASDTNAGAA